MITPFQAMQHAVDIVNTSEHNKNKVAACLVSGEQHIAKTNYRPKILKNHFDAKDRIGNSSQFIHAEVACIFNAPFPTHGASLFITDPMCPNCAKAICEAGIKHVYIDHKGMVKDFFIRRKDAFEQISVPLMREYGVTLSTIYRKNEQIIPFVFEDKDKITPHTQIQFLPEYKTLDDAILARDDFINHRSYALAQIKNGVLYVPEIEHHIPHDNPKYRDDVSPINRLLCHMGAHNLTLVNDTVFCNLHPSSRDLVNAVGFGVKNITIESTIPDHDIHGENATTTLKQFDILHINEL